MPSSTSSSDATARARLPGGALVAPWIAALVVAGAVVGALEATWRARGHAPSAADDAELWSAVRRRASSSDGRSVVLLGKSRMQSGFSPEVFAARFPDHDVHMLAVVGKGAWAAFADLAADERFRGLVVWDLTEEDLAAPMRDQQAEQVAFARASSTPSGRLHASLRAEVQARSAALSPDVSLPRLVEQALVAGGAPRPAYVTTDPARFQRADFEKADLPRIVAEYDAMRADMSRRARAPLDPRPWLSDARALQPLVDALRARGGDVVLVRFPLSGAARDFQERFYPRASFWDALGSSTTAHRVHFEDLPGEPYVCPDTSHLDRRDVPRFTGALLDEIARRGLLPRR